MSHSPIPWFCFANDGSRDRNFTITDSETATESGIGKGTNVIATVVPVSSGKHHQANAEFIVRACNCHDELLAALQTLVSLTHRICENSYGQSVDDAYERARAIIAKATGK